MLKTLQAKYGFYKVLGNPDIQVINPALGRAVYFERHRKGDMYEVSPLQLYLDLKGMAAGKGLPKQFLESLIRPK